MTTEPELTAALREALSEHLWSHTATTHCACGFRAPIAQRALMDYLEHVAQAIAPLVAQREATARAEGRAEVVAAVEAYLRTQVDSLGGGFHLTQVAGVRQALAPFAADVGAEGAK
jgi:hypothetical protein